MEESNNTYKSMRSKYYEEKCKFMFGGELIYYSDGTSQWEFGLFDSENKKYLWKGTLQKLAQKLLQKD